MKKSEKTAPSSPLEKAVRKWQDKKGLNVFPEDLSYDPAFKAIQRLAHEGCTPADVRDLLELLRIYASTTTFERVKNNRERWLDRLKNLVLRIRRVAKDAEKDMSFIRHNRPRKRVRWLDLDLWDEWRTQADNLESYIKIMGGKKLDFGMVFGRKFGGTLVYLVLAAELITEATQQPHYAEIATILERVSPRKPLSEFALSKKIVRFKKRQPDFVEESVQGKRRVIVREWLAGWYAIEPFVSRRKRAHSGESSTKGRMNDEKDHGHQVKNL
jgi:hypothetical protein